MASTAKTTASPAICDYEGSTYRTDFWVGQGREYEDRVERIALRKLLPPTGERLVEIGAGFGRLADLYGGYGQVILVDYAISQLRQAQERLGADGRFVFVAANLYHLPFPAGCFDTAVTVRVLHHVQDLPAALAEIGRVLGGGGTFVLEYANKRHLRAVLRQLAGRARPGEAPFDLSPYEFVPLNFDFHPRYVTQSLEQANVAIEKELSVSLFRLPLLKRWIPTGLLATLDGWLQAPAAGWHMTPSQFVRTRRLGSAGDHGPGSLFACPRCGFAGLEEVADGLHCSGCESQWPVENGIYDFRVSG